VLLRTPRGPGFGNGRFARNLFEAAVGRHAWRLREVAEPTLEQLRTLLPEDLDGPAPEPLPDTVPDLAPAPEPEPEPEPADDQEAAR
jgi:hypothetical protein